MKLEAIDPLNLGNICVATICKVSLGRPPASRMAVWGWMAQSFAPTERLVLGALTLTARCP